MTDQDQPTVVLVHGALTGTSVWRDVVTALQQKGLPVVAPAMPLRGLASDAAYLAAFVASVPGPVVLVGHSYAGSVISHPALADPKVRALVYVAAFQPDAGESTGELNERFPGSRLGPDTTTVLAHPDGNDLYLTQADFRDVYAGDVPAEVAAVLAATQRPIDPSALGEELPGPATWHTIPSWALVSTRDNSLPTEALRFMAARAGSRTVEVDSSHAAPVSHPEDVVTLILDAVGGVR
jgi:pimeloyl-ACP methyl ester carboxylesterase